MTVLLVVTLLETLAASVTGAIVVGLPRLSIKRDFGKSETGVCEKTYSN